MTAPWTGHLLPGHSSQPRTALMLRCHLHAGIRISCRSDPSPSGERVGTMLLCRHLNPSWPTTCKGDIPMLSSSPNPWGRGHPPPGHVLHVLTCPPISSCPTAPMGWSFCAAPCPWTRCVAAGRARGQRTGAWTLGAGKEEEHLGYIKSGFCSWEAGQEMSLSANTVHGEVVRCLLRVILLWNA